MHKRRVAAPAALALSMASLTAAVAHADTAGITYYVNNGSGSDCSDSGPGTEAQPFCSVTRAAAVATTPGDTVLIAPGGTYNGNVEITASGTAADPITFEAEQTPTAPTAQNLTIDGGLLLDGADYVDFSGAYFHQGLSTSVDVELDNSSHDTVSDLSLLDGGLLVFGSSGNDTVSRVNVEFGPMESGEEGLSGNGIEVDSSGTGNVITTNLIEDRQTGFGGIVVDGSADAVVTSNTVQDYCGNGIAIGDDANGIASGATVENNVVEGSACEDASGAGISVQSTADEAGLTANYNDVDSDGRNSADYDWAGTTYQTAAALNTAVGQGANDSNANTDLGTYTGLIQSESSPVINSANANAPGELSTDFAGNARVADPNVPETGAGTPGYDRGAYQYAENLGVGSVALPASAPVGAAVTPSVPTVSDNWANASFTYKYDFGDGTPVVTTTSATPVSHTYTTAGTYTVTVTVSSGFGASKSITDTIDVLKAVTFGATLTTKAENGLGVQPQAAVTDDWPITSQTINYGDGSGTTTFTGSTVPSHSYAQPGTYTVTYTVKDYSGAVQTATSSFTTAGSDYTPIPAVRMLDTATGTGGSSSQLLNNGSIKLKVAGVDGIPSTVTAVDINLTAFNANVGGYIEANDGTLNGTSNLNYGPKLIYSNSVIAPVAADGTVTLSNHGLTAADKTDLIADVSGYFSSSQADTFEPVTTSRLLDTRSGQGGSKGPLEPGKTDVLTVEGAGGVPSSGVAAVAVNLTVVDTTRQGFVVAYADGSPVPGTSDEDWQSATTKATNVIVPVGSDGKIDITNAAGDLGSTDVLVDVTGYFRASAAGDVYVPITPTRAMDTRTTSAIGPGAADSRWLDLSGVGGIPAASSGAPAIQGFVANATATDTEQQGFLLLSNGESGVSTSTVNFTGAGQTVANLAIVEPTTSGDEYEINVENGSVTKPVQAIVDVMGYFITG
jgi:parallel beta-helix repeat protein